MEFDKFQSAIDNKSDIIIPHYFNGDETEFADSILHLHDKFGTPEVQLISRPFSVSNVSKSKSFLNFCRKEPKLIGSILYLNLGETTFLDEDIKSFSKSGSIKWGKIPTIETLAAAEQIFQKAKQKIKQLLNKEKILKKDTNDILKLIEPLYGAEHYDDIQQIYWMLYCELRFTLQLLKPDKDFDLSFGFDKEWLNLREKDVPLLNLLSLTGLKKYSESSFRKKTIIKLNESYNNYLIPEQQPKKPSIVSDSVIKIKMIPKPGKPADNIIIINNNKFEKVRNVPFELLYYLLWLRNHNLDVSTGLETNQTINPEHINEMTKNNVMIKRFGAVWNNAINPGMKEAKSTAVSDINKILKNQLKIDFVAIKEDSGYYKLSSRFKQEDIELEPF